MIIWNVEGSTDFSIKYVGDPRMVEYMSPEMDKVADEYFKRILDAGFRTGVCLRPTTIRASGRPTGRSATVTATRPTRT
jgi:hypothetical protein